MKIALPLLAVLVLLAGGCNSAVDDPDSNVILEVLVTESPAITGQDDGVGGCLFTITEWSADFLNQPKNESATISPYNDIIIRSWYVSYSWPGSPGIIPPPPRELPSPGTIPAFGQQSVTFSPILFDDLEAAWAGTSAILTMTVNAVTVSGETIRLTISEQLDIESCG
jgi:hypothetical protein